MTNLVFTVLVDTNGVPIASALNWSQQQDIFFSGFGLGAILAGSWLTIWVVRRALSPRHFGGSGE